MTPLGGYRVVELTHQLVGPLAGMYLADFGAEVIKVEPPTGDPRRSLSPLQFLAVNRNKRSVTIDLRSQAGRRVLERLLEIADVLLTNYSVEALQALELDEDAVRQRHPKLITCSMTAFGPQSERRGFDLNVCGELGLLLEDRDGAPRSNAAPFADTGGALMLAFGVTLALLNRERGGGAQHVETSLSSICVALMAHRFLWLDGAPAPDLSPGLRTSTFHAVYGAYKTSDGYVTIGVISYKLWRRLCLCLQLEALLGNYATWDHVLAGQDMLRPILETRFRTATTDHWLAVLVDAGVPAGRVLHDEAIFEHPDLVATDMVATFDHPGGSYRAMGFPLRLAVTPATLVRHAPALGADTRTVLGELGYDTHAIRALEIERVIGAA